MVAAAEGNVQAELLVEQRLPDRLHPVVRQDPQPQFRDVGVRRFDFERMAPVSRHGAFALDAGNAVPLDVQEEQLAVELER